MVEHTAGKIINLFQKQWQLCFHICSLSAAQLYNRNSPPLRIVVDNWPDLCQSFTYCHFGFIFSGLQTLTRCCEPHGEASICCVQSVSSCLRCSWFRCVVPNCIWGMKSSPYLTPESDIAHETGAQESGNLGLNSIRFWFPKVLFSFLSRSYSLVWIQLYIWCH